MNRISVVKTHPHQCQDIRRVARKPGIPEIIRGTGFTGDRPGDTPVFQGTGRPFGDDALKHGIHNKRFFRRDQPFYLQVFVFENFTIFIDHPFQR